MRLLIEGDGWSLHAVLGLSSLKLESALDIDCKFQKSGLVKAGLFEALHECADKFCNELRGVLGSRENLSLQKHLLLCKCAENHFVCCSPLRALGTEERGSSVEAHNFARFLGVRNVVNELDLDPQLVCAIQKRIVKCRMKVPLKENPRRRGKIRERHVFLGRAAMPFRQHDGEWNTPNGRAAQERVFNSVADNREVELAAANA